MLQNQPYVKRTQEFFNMIKTSMGADSLEWQRFKEELNQGKNTDSYEKPLMMIYNKVRSNALLTKIFIELSPEVFVQRMLPDCQQDLVKNFDELVRSKVSAETYQNFQHYALQHLNNQHSVKEFRQNLEALFKGHHEIFASLPNFFCDANGDLSIKPVHISTNQSVTTTGRNLASQTKKTQKVAQTPIKRRNEYSDPSVDSGRRYEIQSQINVMANQLPAQLARQVPDELRNFAKGELTLFTEKLPQILQNKSLSQSLLKLIDLYTTGVLTSTELLAMIDDIRMPDSPQVQEVMKQLVGLIAGREKSRREHSKNMLKPMCEVDSDERVSLSYYKLPAGYPMPICSGQYDCQELFNNTYYCLGTSNANYQLKRLYDNEEALFKNEDDMYKVDHNIVQLEMILGQLQKELKNAEIYERLPNPKQRYEVKHLSKFSIDKIQDIYSQQAEKEVVIGNKIIKAPVKIVSIFIDRLTILLTQYKQDRENSIEMWNQVSESNFFKSLDQMVFFFKAQQSKMYKQKQMELELKQLSGLKNKSIEQLKGGCQRGEFFCTYQSFSFNNVVLYPADVAQTPEVAADHPINLQDPQLLEDPSLLPQMRLIFQETQVLERTIELLLYATRNMNQSTSERAKLESTFELLATHFFQLDFAKINQESRSLNPPTDQHITFLMDMDLYVQWKQQGGQFKRHQEFTPSQQPQSTPTNQQGDTSQFVNLLPDQKGMLVPYFKQGYSLFYGSPFCFCLLKMIATIYERLLKAHQLINQETAGKLSNADAKICQERFDMFVAVMLLTLCGQQLSSDRKVDSQEYEEIARQMMGKEAYLIFSFDKLITQTLKIMLQSGDEDFTASLGLFKWFSELDKKSEHYYLKNFVIKMEQGRDGRDEFVRLLYSPVSKILSVHLVNQQFCQKAKVTEIGQIQPVFLERNLEKMRTVRQVTEVEVTNGLVLRQLPATNRVYYQEGTEDVIEYRRKTGLSLADQFKTMHKQVLGMDTVLKRRRL